VGSSSYRGVERCDGSVSGVGGREDDRGRPGGRYGGHRAGSGDGVPHRADHSEHPPSAGGVRADENADVPRHWAGRGVRVVRHSLCPTHSFRPL
ncbi:MAG: ATP synthase F0 sector subunit c, partial [uncultured Rubrobacteraceae bacterium]